MENERNCNFDLLDEHTKLLVFDLLDKNSLLKCILVCKE